MSINSGVSCKKLNTKGCWTLNLAQPLGKLFKERERAIHQRDLAEQAERWRAHSLEIYDEAELLCQLRDKEVLAERDIVSQLQEHLAETRLSGG